MNTFLRQERAWFFPNVIVHLHHLVATTGEDVSERTGGARRASARPHPPPTSRPLPLPAFPHDVVSSTNIMMERDGGRMR
ncbi:MAG TPA: hypothetical protein VFU49_06520 [Ktedonobacteraceae bacterium]|nr:hypothetical protein [Ktedonobacteraceae bacterium]